MSLRIQTTKCGIRITDLIRMFFLCLRYCCQCLGGNHERNNDANEGVKWSHEFEWSLLSIGGSEAPGTLAVTHRNVCNDESDFHSIVGPHDLVLCCNLEQSLPFRPDENKCRSRSQDCAEGSCWSQWSWDEFLRNKCNVAGAGGWCQAPCASC